MSKFKAGDFALIVKGSASSINVGRTVRLIECLGAPAIYDWDGRQYKNTRRVAIWVIEVDGKPLVDRFGGYQTKGPICEDKLMPLRGDFQPEQQKSREVPA